MLAMFEQFGKNLYLAELIELKRSRRVSYTLQNTRSLTSGRSGVELFLRLRWWMMGNCLSVNVDYSNIWALFAAMH
jgi:hypothetical protein